MKPRKNRLYAAILISMLTLGSCGGTISDTETTETSNDTTDVVTTEAAEKLGELERAYQDVLNDLQSKENRQQYGTEYGEIEALIKSGELTEAQQKLDDIPVHDGEWHYLQSIVFYKKNWFLESKKQLEYALKADPENTKYRNSLNKLQQILASNTISPDQLHSKESHTTDGTSRGKGIPTCTGNCCSDLCIADCCCECMGGDLIPCC